MIGSSKNVSVIIKRFCQSKSRELNVNYRLNRGDASVYLLVVIGVLQLVMSLCQPFMIHRTEWFYFKYKIMAVFLSSNWTTCLLKKLRSKHTFSNSVLQNNCIYSLPTLICEKLCLGCKEKENDIIFQKDNSNDILGKLCMFV